MVDLSLERRKLYKEEKIIINIMAILRLGSLVSIEAKIQENFKGLLLAEAQTINSAAKIKCKLEFSTEGAATYVCQIYTGFFKKKDLFKIHLEIEGDIKDSCQIKKVLITFEDSSMKKLENSIKILLEKHLYIDNSYPIIVSSKA